MIINLIVGVVCSIAALFCFIVAIMGGSFVVVSFALLDGGLATLNFYVFFTERKAKEAKK